VKPGQCRATFRPLDPAPDAANEERFITPELKAREAKNPAAARTAPPRREYELFTQLRALVGEQAPRFPGLCPAGVAALVARLTGRGGGPSGGYLLPELQ